MSIEQKSKHNRFRKKLDNQLFLQGTHHFSDAYFSRSFNRSGG